MRRARKTARRPARAGSRTRRARPSEDALDLAAADALAAMGLSPADLLTKNVLSFDPGARHPAAAVFVRGVLRAASRVKLPGAFAKLPLGQRAHNIAFLTEAWARAQVFGSIDVVVYELPQVYRGRKNKGDPNDLIMLAVIAGEVAGRFPKAHVIEVTPRRWSGGTSKTTTGDAWDSIRGRRLIERLTPEERACVQDTHDALDSAGIGLWCLGRFSSERRLIGASDG